MQSIIADILDERKAARAAGDGSSRTDDEDLLEVLLRLQAEDSLEFPLTTEIIGAVMFVSIFYFLSIYLFFPYTRWSSTN